MELLRKNKSNNNNRRFHIYVYITAGVNLKQDLLQTNVTNIP